MQAIWDRIEAVWGWFVAFFAALCLGVALIPGMTLGMGVAWLLSGGALMIVWPHLHPIAWLRRAVVAGLVVFVLAQAWAIYRGFNPRTAMATSGSGRRLDVAGSNAGRTLGLAPDQTAAAETGSDVQAHVGQVENTLATLQLHRLDGDLTSVSNALNWWVRQGRENEPQALELKAKLGEIKAHIQAITTPACDKGWFGSLGTGWTTVGKVLAAIGCGIMAIWLFGALGGLIGGNWKPVGRALGAALVLIFALWPGMMYDAGACSAQGVASAGEDEV
ncbi:hypothetical protein HY634_03055, partial [Candidatus Uhrbacteria bacterium]|nr:hypothetical protein [Candidatus Uhrbacteria bacterium]